MEGKLHGQHGNYDLLARFQPICARACADGNAGAAIYNTVGWNASHLHRIKTCCIWGVKAVCIDSRIHD